MPARTRACSPSTPLIRYFAGECVSVMARTRRSSGRSFASARRRRPWRRMPAPAHPPNCDRCRTRGDTDINASQQSRASLQGYDEGGQSLTGGCDRRGPVLFPPQQGFGTGPYWRHEKALRWKGKRRPVAAIRQRSWCARRTRGSDC